MTQSFSKQAVKVLADYLLANVSGIAQVLSEWPSANIELNYPAISITTKGAPFTPCDPYVLELGVLDEEANSSINTYVIGQYDLKLQIDIWARNKEERYEYYDKFFSAFNASLRPVGLRLQLTEYYDRWIAYTETGYRFDDTQKGSETESWRVTVDIEATCDAVREAEEFIITQEIGLTLELPSPVNPILP